MLALLLWDVAPRTVHRPPHPLRHRPRPGRRPRPAPVQVRYAIERTCTGWQAQDRSASIFVDEFKELAGSSPDVITWLRNRGRSYGVRPHFATQYPDQLAAEVRDALVSFNTLIAFTQGTPRIARELVEDFAGDGTEWTVADVLDLPPFHAIVRVNVDHKRQPPFPFASAHFVEAATGRLDVEASRAAQQRGGDSS